jgi:hypothetical protein
MKFIGYSGINNILHISDRVGVYKFHLTVKILSIHAVSACIMQTIVVYIDQLNPDCL